MRLYAITDRRLLGPDERTRRTRLLALVREWVRGGVGSVQLREKDLPGAALRDLAAELAEAMAGSGAQLFVNVGGLSPSEARDWAPGVHLPGVPAVSVAGLRPLSVSAHTVAEAAAAGRVGASAVLFAPVWEKRIGETVLPGVGLDRLAQAAAAAGSSPVYALGGVSAENAADCVQAGAAGVAAIRLFLGDSWRQLR